MDLASILEEVDRLALGEGDDRPLGVGTRAVGERLAVALALPVAVERVHPQNLDPEDRLDSIVDLGLGGPLIVQPIPEDKGLDPAWLEETIDEALLYAEREGIRGNAVTPFLLRAVAEATGGASIEANLALLISNARTAAEIAVSLAGMNR